MVTWFKNIFGHFSVVVRRRPSSSVVVVVVRRRRRRRPSSSSVFRRPSSSVVVRRPSSVVRRRRPSSVVVRRRPLFGYMPVRWNIAFKCLGNFQNNCLCVPCVSSSAVVVFVRRPSLFSSVKSTVFCYAASHECTLDQFLPTMCSLLQGHQSWCHPQWPQFEPALPRAPKAMDIM